MERERIILCLILLQKEQSKDQHTASMAALAGVERDLLSAFADTFGNEFFRYLWWGRGECCLTHLPLHRYTFKME